MHHLLHQKKFYEETISQQSELFAIIESTNLQYNIFPDLCKSWKINLAVSVSSAIIKLLIQ